MSIVVEHEKRRYEILEKALDVFIDEGFSNVTYQKIADRCGITRTTLYRYFKNKRDIFNFCMKQFLQALEANITAILQSETLSYAEKLSGVMLVIINRIEEKRLLLLVVMDFLLHTSKGGYDADYRVRRRTIRLRHILTKMIIEGINCGEFKGSLDVKHTNELLNGLLEAAIFRVVVLRRETVDELKDATRQAVRCLVVDTV